MSDKHPVTTNANKDVIYIDVDDEITGIIEKVRDSEKKIVALVLPKRAAVLQSIVNMKLLKRTAETSKKNLVLITSEAGLLPLAGSVGIHVAKSLQSKPEIPDAPDHPDNQPEDIQDTADDSDDQSTVDAALDKTKSIGELAGAAAIEETIELDDEDEPAADDPAYEGKAKPAKGKDKKFKIPNFSRFRLLLVLGIIALILLGGLAYAAMVVLPEAHITIKTDTSAVDSSTTLSLNPKDGVALDVPSGTLPAHLQQVQKVVSQQVPTTGQQNNGTKATGTIKFYNCNKDDTLSGTDHTIPAGTGVSANGLTFITAQAVNVEPSHFIGNNCTKDKPSATITMTALAAGSKYNQSAGTYSVAGSGYSTITGSGSATSGGTDNVIQVVTQADIDSATQKIGAQDTSGIKQELHTDLTNGGFFAIDSTFATAAPDTKTSSQVGEQAATVTVTQTLTYTMLGAKQDDLQKVIANDVSSKIDPKKQSILDYGLAKATFTIQNPIDGGGQVVLAQTTIVAGPDLNTATIKQQVAGKKSGDAEEIIKTYPGVSSVKVSYSPFWVSSIPSNTSKIGVTIEKPQAGSENAAP